MDLGSLIVTVFCLIDDTFTAALDVKPVRQRRPQPLLAAAEVLTIEAVGDYLGLDQGTAIFSYFRRHFGHFFPSLRHIHRTTFTRQAAYLWRIKERLWQRLSCDLEVDRAVSLIDSFPVPVCRFAPARRCR